MSPKAVGAVGEVRVSKGVLADEDETREFKKLPLGVVSVKLKTSLVVEDGRLTTKLVGLA
jgi:hypothetical protein